MIRFIIVDDEVVAHDIIKEYCAAIPDLEFVASCYDAFEARTCLKNNTVDLMFLDLNMPKLKGFDFLRTLVVKPKVIVTTAYQDKALEGYELNVLDYLLKPFSFERFFAAINKIESPQNTDSKTVTSNESSIFFKSQRKYIQVKLNDILYVESLGNYCKIVCTNDAVQIREKISQLALQLPEDAFMRVHKSFIVAKSHINTIEGNLISIRSDKIPIGKLYREGVSRLLK